MKRRFTLIELMIVIAIIAIIAAIAIPNLIEARKSGNEASAIGALRTISTSQSVFREVDRDGNGTNDFAATLIALGTPTATATALIDPAISSGTKQGYSFAMTAPAATLVNNWFCAASPITTLTGNRHFAANQSGVINFSALAIPAPAAGAPMGGTPLGAK